MPSPSLLGFLLVEKVDGILIIISSQWDLEDCYFWRMFYLFIFSLHQSAEEVLSIFTSVANIAESICRECE